MYRILGADGREYGPISGDLLRQWIAEGRANATTPARTEGDTGWKSLGTFPEFSMLSAAAPAAFATPTYHRPKNNGFAVTALVLGILSLLFGPWCCCCYGAPFNIAGLIFSILALGQIRSDPDRYGGKGMAIAGLVLCLSSIALVILLMILAGVGEGLGRMHHHVYRL
jgi:hypothetical protein